MSSIAKFFDPLGWLAPVVITGKIFLQKLWLEKLDWDAKLPHDLCEEFLSWYNGMSAVKNIKISRWLHYVPMAKYELYGFADASLLAYGACTYLKVTVNGTSAVHLLQAKSKVAPIKPLMTIPKLELMAALLLARLSVKVLRALNLEKVDIFLFSDSTDVLHWLKEHPSKWPMFVANRCSKIHSYLPEAFWSHVSTKDNPADCVSRGIKPDQLESFSLWWGGGERLNSSPNFNNCIQSNSVHLVAFNCHTNTKKIIPKCEHWDLVAKYSDLQKLLRVTSYILRFIDRLLIKCGIKNKRVVNCNSKLFKTEWFQVSYQLCCFKTPSVSELIRARLVWVFVVQNSHFCKDIELLKMDKDEKLNNSNLNSVNPYLQDNLLRVGGRVQASLLDPDEKHPIILPFKCKLSNLVIKFCHEKKLHAGIRLTYSTVRQEFWIVIWLKPTLINAIRV